jgi:hypothetical protein
MTRLSGKCTIANIVMAVLVTAIHVLFPRKTWMPGTSPGMTSW